MAERRTLLSQVSKDPGPLQAGTVRTPDGAFGDFSGMRSFGNDAAQTGQALSDDYAREQNRQRHELAKAKAKYDAIAHQNIAAKFTEASINASLAVDQAVNTATQDAEVAGAPLVGTKRTEFIEKQSGIYQKSIDKEMQVMRDRYPELYAEAITPEVVGASWARAKDGHIRQGFGYSAQVTQRETYMTTARNNATLLLDAAATPDGLFNRSFALQNQTSKMGGLEVTQRLQLISKLQQDTAGLFSQQYGHTEFEDMVNRAARDQVITVADQNQLLAGNKAFIDGGGKTGPANRSVDRLGELLRTGGPKDFTQQDQIIGEGMAAADSLPDGQKRVMTKLAIDNLIGQTLNVVTNGSTVMGEMDILKTNQLLQRGIEDKDVRYYVNRRMLDSYYQLADESPNFAKAQMALDKASGNPMALQDVPFGDDDVKAAYGQLSMFAKRQSDLVYAKKGAQVLRYDKDVQTARASGLPGAYIGTLISKYQSMGITDPGLWDISDPERVDAMILSAKDGSAEGVAKTRSMLMAYVRDFGAYSKDALTSLSASGTSVFHGAVGMMAQVTDEMATNTDAGERLITNYLQAAAFVDSEEFKGYKEKFPEVIKQADHVLDVALSKTWQDKFSIPFDTFMTPGKKGFGLLDQPARFPTSPLAQILTNDGNLNSVYAAIQANMYMKAFGPSTGRSTNTATVLYNAAEASRKESAIYYSPTSATGAQDKTPMMVNNPNRSTERVNIFQQDSPDTFHNFQNNAEMAPATVDGAIFAQLTGKGTLGYATQYTVDKNLALTLAGAWTKDITTFEPAPNLGTRFFKQSLQAKNLGVGLFNGIDMGTMHVTNDQGKSVPLARAVIVPRDAEGRVRVSATEYFKKADPHDAVILAFASNYLMRYDESRKVVQFYIKPGSVDMGVLGSSRPVGNPIQVMYTKQGPEGPESVPLEVPYSQLNSAINSNRESASYLGLDMKGEKTELQKAKEKNLQNVHWTDNAPMGY